MNKLSFLRWIVIFAFAHTASLAIAAEPVQVEVKLSDGSDGKMSLNLSTLTVAAGPVEFVVQNQSSSLTGCGNTPLLKRRLSLCAATAAQFSALRNFNANPTCFSTV